MEVDSASYLTTPDTAMVRTHREPPRLTERYHGARRTPPRQGVHVAGVADWRLPLNNQRGTKMMNFGYSGVLGLLILIGDIWAIINILQSAASNEKKLIWIVAVVLLPLLGLVLWFFLGPRDRKA
jgi:hypothetical protein